VSFYRVCGLLLLTATFVFAQNNLIQPLPALQKELKGKLERVTVQAKSLEGNLEGDSPDRDVYVYLPPNLKKMKAIEMNVGLQDALLQTNRDMDTALTDAGVAHRLETFEGDHNGQVPVNFQMKVLPFFSRELTFPN
jgi:hypothetical protein